MYQIQGIDKLHPFAIYTSNGTAATALTNVSCKCRINGGSVVTLTDPTITYSSDMKTFLITIPGTLAVNAYDSIEVYINSSEGEAHLLIDVMMDISKFIYRMQYKTKFI